MGKVDPDHDIMGILNGQIDEMRDLFPGNEARFDKLSKELDPDNFLYRIELDPHIEKRIDIAKVPKGGWDLLEALVPIVLKYNPGPIVEIGMGESTTIFADKAYQAGVKLYSCDVLMGGMFSLFSKPLFDDHVCFIGKSEDFIKEFDDEPAIVFLDGEHSYDAVKKEVDFFLPRLKTAGVMFMHDTFPCLERYLVKDKLGRRPGDIYRMRQELENDPNIDVFTWPYSALGMGLTMVMKYAENKNRPYWLKNGRCFVEVD